jgi:hypothetical protein
MLSLGLAVHFILLHPDILRQTASRFLSIETNISPYLDVFIPVVPLDEASHYYCHARCCYPNLIRSYASLWPGVLLAALEKGGVIQPLDKLDDGTSGTSAGTVSAGYQNFLVCIEMFFAAIALRYAFPISVYSPAAGAGMGFGHGRSVTMQSISSSLKVRQTSNEPLILASFQIIQSLSSFQFMRIVSSPSRNSYFQLIE